MSVGSESDKGNLKHRETFQDDFRRPGRPDVRIEAVFAIFIILEPILATFFEKRKSQISGKKGFGDPT